DNSVQITTPERSNYRKFLPELRAEQDRALEHKLMTKCVTLSIQEMPLENVIKYLKFVSGVNVVADMAALEEAGISLDVPLSLQVEHVSLKSALNLLLKKINLTYVIKDEAL